MKTLKNHILIAMPHMQDPYFSHTVVLICEHTEDGAMGLIINRPFEDPDLKELFTEIYAENEDLLKIVPRVYFGGPVMVERGIVLHSGSYSATGTMTISDTFSLTSHRDILRDINKNNGPEQFKLMLGHVGWAPGQMEGEIERGDWLLQNVTHDFVFNIPENMMWKHAARALGIETNEIAGVGGQA